MIKEIMSKKIILSTAVIGLFLLFSAPASAQTKYNFKTLSGLNTTAQKAGYDISADSTSLDSVIGTIIYTILSFVGVLFFILTVYGAFLWMTAQGNDERVKKAKTMLTNSIIGLIITLSAYAISYFLISRFA